MEDTTFSSNLFPLKSLENSFLDKNHLSNLYQELLDIFGLSKFFDFDENNMSNRFNNMSGGEKQKIAVMRTLLKNASLFIFDEPTSMMDKESIDHFCDIINKIKGDKIIIIISHDDRLLCCCDEIIEL